jgi:hypothetical protein
MTKDFLKILAPPALVFIFHLVLIFAFDLYDLWPDLDIVMHFLGGASIALSSLFFTAYLQRTKRLGHISPVVKFLFVISLVAIVAVFWEFAEFALDHLARIRWQGDLNDTLLDLAMGLIGGASIALLIQYKRKV